MGHGCLAALSAHYGYLSTYAVRKPLPMVFSMACVWLTAHPSRYPIAWALLLGLFLSMVGDISLQFEKGFVLGLAAFSCAHIAYLFVLRRDTTRWRPSSVAALVFAASTSNANLASEISCKFL